MAGCLEAIASASRNAREGEDESGEQVLFNRRWGPPQIGLPRFGHQHSCSVAWRSTLPYHSVAASLLLRSTSSSLQLVAATVTASLSRRISYTLNLCPAKRSHS